MPQITSASYNLGNSRQSSRSNSFNRRNSGEFTNQQNIIAERLRLVNEAKLLKQTQLANRPKLAILFNPNTYSPDALKLIEYIKDDTSASRFTIIYYTDLLNTLEEQYNLGFRFFASPTIGSFDLYTYCISFCKKYPDALLFTTYSTQYFEDGVLPFNIIRSSVNDKDLTHYIVTEVLYKVHTLTKDSAPLYYKPISNVSLDNTYPIFEKIVYIYTEKDANGNPDTYSEGYREQLLNAINLTNGNIEIQSYKITDDNFILPEEVKTLLSENPVSEENFKTSTKTIFFLNSYSPEKILQLFDEEYMYNNYFIFGDVFPSNHYTSNYKFNYAICPLGNYSFEGYKTAGFLPGGRQLSPFLYSINDVILKLLPYYTKIYYTYPNFSSTKFNEYFINRMKEINLFVDNNYWYERKIFTYYIGTNADDLTNAQYNRHIFYNFKFNPTSQSQIITKTFEYMYDNTNLQSFNSQIHSPIINNSNTFSLLNIDSTNSGNTTTVRIEFELNNNNVLIGNDGLTFKNVIGYYTNTTVIITKFSGIPLSKNGEQFANLARLSITATDSPTIFSNTFLNKTFYNCSKINSNLSNWDVSKAVNMDSMFENATIFNNNRFPLKWTCSSLTSALNFGLNSSLYGLGGNYNVNPGNGVRNNEKTSIETPTKTLTTSNSSLPLKSGTFIFKIEGLQSFDNRNIPIINSNSFITLSQSQNLVYLPTSVVVTLLYSYKIILGNDGLSFKDIYSYYGSNRVIISQFGNIPLSRGGEQFANLPNLVISATDNPTILTNTSLNKSFYNCTNFNSNIRNWDVSNVTNMTSMFENSTAFNNNNTSMKWNCKDDIIADNFGLNSALYVNQGDYTLNFGNASRSNNMSSIQTPIFSYDGVFIYSFINTGLLALNYDMLPINNASRSFSVINMSYSISGNITTVTIIYNIPTIISNYDGLTFKNASAYYASNNITILKFGNIPLSRGGEQFANLDNFVISAGDTPNILPNTSLRKAFFTCSNFNSNISNWNVSGVTNMESMFENASSFNKNISGWNVSNVTNMSSMFKNASKFNNNNTPMNWNCNSALVSTNFGYNSDLYVNNDYRKIASVGNAKRIGNKSIETPIYNYGTFIYITTKPNIDPTNVISRYLPIINTNSSFIIDTITISNNTVITKFSYNSIIHHDGLSFKNVTDNYGTYNITIIQFEGIPLSKSGEQFSGLENLVISAADTPNILPNTSLEKAFYNCSNFNSNISNWNVSEAINMSSMFQNASSFNQDINSWNVSKVTNMDSMFENASKFCNKMNVMFWDCDVLVSATNFGLNSSLYETEESFNINPRNAVRKSINSIDYYSIETGTNNTKYRLTPAQVTDLTLKSGTFTYKFVKTGLSIFNPDIHLPIINKKSFICTTTYNTREKTIYVTVNFSYRFILDDDGLSFRDVVNYYLTNTVEITDFDGIPLSSYNNYQLLKFPKLFSFLGKKDTLKLACTSKKYPTIKKPSSIPADTIVYFTEIRDNGDQSFLNVPSVYTKIKVYLVGGGGSGGIGGRDQTTNATWHNDGANGSGGGGGEYSKIDSAIIADSNFKITIGNGGASVVGPKNSNTSQGRGNDGNNGSASYLYIPSTNISHTIKASGGEKGYGGDADTYGQHSLGGGYNEQNNARLFVGEGSVGRGGADSGYLTSIKNDSYEILSYLGSDSGSKYENFGNGGDGTRGTDNGVWDTTTRSQNGFNGYARVYFIT